MMGDFQRVGSSPSRVCSRIQSRSTRSAVTRARTHKIANGDRSLADRAAQLIEVRRPYRLWNGMVLQRWGEKSEIEGPKRAQLYRESWTERINEYDASNIAAVSSSVEQCDQPAKRMTHQDVRRRYLGCGQ